MDRSPRAAQLWITLSVLTAALGCASSASPADAGRAKGAKPDAAASMFLGEVDGTDARVALLATEHHARLYVCGGPDSYMGLTHWFSADLDAQHHLDQEKQADGDWELHAELGSDAHGTLIAPDGGMHEFSADRVSASAHMLAGLYEASAGCGKLGLIVVQPKAGSDAVAQGACVADDLVTVEQVNPVLPVSLASDGSVHVTVGADNEEIALSAAKPPTN